NTDQDTSVGYVFLSEDPVAVTEEEVTRSRQYVRTSNPDTDVTKNVFGVTYHHDPSTGPDTVAYALVPDASPDDMTTYAGVDVLANTADVQAIEHETLGLTAVNVSASDGARTGPVDIDGPASVIMQRTEGRRIDVSVSDPTFE